jgi:ribosomal protein S6--L-glutamate ligase
MQTVLIVSGETYWADYLPGYKVEQKKIQTTDWLLKDGALYAVDAAGVCRPDKILWRVGAIRPQAKHKTALDLIALSGVPCVNAATTLLRGYDRLSMLTTLKQCGLPVIAFNAATASTHVKNIEIDFPFVVKAGNYHGGFGKVLVDTPERWQDVKDLLFVTEDYVTVEPYIKYERDIRYLAVGNNVWAMARRGKFWKANVETTDFVLIDAEPELTAQVKKLQQYLQADIVAIDVLEDAHGDKFVVEYNDIPGLSGFPEEVRQKLADCLKAK